MRGRASEESKSEQQRGFGKFWAPSWLARLLFSESLSFSWASASAYITMAPVYRGMPNEISEFTAPRLKYHIVSLVYISPHRSRALTQVFHNNIHLHELLSS